MDWLRRRPRWVRPTAEYVLLAGAAAGLVLPRLDSLPRHRAQGDYWAARGQWPEVIDIVRRTSAFDPGLSVLWARALAHTGGLGTNLFAYPQILGTDSVFPGKYVTGDTALPSCDLWYDLGYVAAAERWACEAQTLQPFAPRVLERLAATSIIQEDWRLADTYLRVLARNPWCRTRANAQRATLADPSQAAADSLIAAKRRQMPLGGIISNDPGKGLEALLAHDPTNRMAYEYLLTYHLLKHEFSDFVARLADWPKLGYGELPRTFQEGLLTAYAAQTPGAAAILGRSPVAPTVLQGFTEFGRVLAHYRGNREQARDELLARFAGTYWFYVNYQSPLVTKVQLRAREVE